MCRGKFGNDDLFWKNDLGLGKGVGATSGDINHLYFLCAGVFVFFSTIRLLVFDSHTIF